MYFGIEVFRWHITGQDTLCSVNEMFGAGCLSQHPSNASDDVSTPEFDSTLLVVIPSHILESV